MKLQKMVKPTIPLIKMNVQMKVKGDSCKYPWYGGHWKQAYELLQNCLPESLVILLKKTINVRGENDKP